MTKDQEIEKLKQDLAAMTHSFNMAVNDATRPRMKYELTEFAISMANNFITGSHTGESVAFDILKDAGIKRPEIMRCDCINDSEKVKLLRIV